MPAFFNAISHFLSNAFLLDAYPNASAAYSVRKLRDAYSGSCLRVRRASDNTEQDIGFDVNGDLDTGALASFCTGTNCFVKTWYDQSGNANDATQTTTANQSKIYNSSTGVFTNNSKPAVQPVAVVGYPSGVSGLSDATIFAVGNNAVGPNSSGQIALRMISSYVGSGAVGANQLLLRYLSTTNQYQVLTNAGTISASGGGQSDNFLFAFKKSSSTGSVGFNGRAYATGTANAITNQLYLFEDTGGIQNENIAAHHEIIIYNSAQSDTNRTGIESNINEYFKMYWNGSQTALLDAYPSASAAYSVRALSSTYTGPLLRVRRASDNVESDIYAKYDGDINESALAGFCAGTNCFVRTWYDQSGGGVNAVQTTTTRQPKIYDSVTGVLKQNGKVRVDFDGTNDGMTFTSVNMDGDSFFSVFTTNDNGVNMILATNDGLTYDQIRTSSNSYEYSRIDNPYFGPSPAGAVATVSTGVSTAQHLFYMDFGSSNLTGAVDGVNGTSHSKQNSNPVAFSVLGALRIGLGGQDYFNGRVQEVILYNGSKSSDQSGVESNINSYYSIY